MRPILTILAGAIAATALATAAPAAEAAPRGAEEIREAIRFERIHIRQKARLMRSVGIKVPRLATGQRWKTTESRRHLRWTLKRIRKHHRKTLHALWHAPPHLYAWNAIHPCEGPWDSAGVYGLYWGGLQMDPTFMRSYAPGWLLARGWANVWTSWEQMWVAERAIFAGRGFHPWPTCARRAGLI